MSWLIKKINDKFEVGHYTPYLKYFGGGEPPTLDYDWEPFCVSESALSAARLCSILNGGNGEVTSVASVLSDL
jgi:hypothetical protein